MLIQASKNGWKEVTADQNYYEGQSCTKHSSTGRHWPTLSNVGLRSTAIQKPKKMTISELVKIVERYECTLLYNNNKLILSGEPENIIKTLSKLATSC